MKALLATALLLTATTAPALASAPHCPPGKLNVWGACLDPVPAPGFGYGRRYERDNYRYDRGYHRHHRGYDRAYDYDRGYDYYR